MNEKHLLPLMLLLALLFNATRSGAQPTAASYSLQDTYQHTITSHNSHRSYQLVISLPRGYNPKDTTRYRVLYVLDANVFLPLVASMQRFYVLGEEAPNLIIVGIGYAIKDIMEMHPLRNYDLTPTSDTSFDAELTAYLKTKSTSGGAAAFLQTIQEDIIPFVEKAYKTLPDRALCGHSFGGLFASYTLFHAPHLFNRYLVSSPSYPWDKNSIFKDEEAFFESHPAAVNARIFFSLGGSEVDFMHDTFQKMITKLKERNYKGLVMESHIIENETHTSVVPIAFAQGLKAIYAKEK